VHTNPSNFNRIYVFAK